MFEKKQFQVPKGSEKTITDIQHNEMLYNVFVHNKLKKNYSTMLFVIAIFFKFSKSEKLDML